MAGRRLHPTGEDLPADSQKGERQKDSLRDDTGGRLADGIRLPANKRKAPKQKGLRKPRKKPPGPADQDAEVKAVPLREPFGSLGCKCSECPYAVNGQPKDFLLPERKAKPDGLLVLGSGPTSEDIQRQEPLTGNMGKELRETFDEAGIHRERIMVIHAYACTPTKLRKDKDERAAVHACRPLLLNAIKNLPPSTPTLLAGKWATLAVLGKEKGLMNSRGFTDREWTLADVPAELTKGKVDDEKESKVETEDTPV